MNYIKEKVGGVLPRRQVEAQRGKIFEGVVGGPQINLEKKMKAVR